MNIETRSAVLQAFTHGESYGLEIIERVRELTNGEVVLSMASVYPAIRALEEEGLLKGYELPGALPENGRPRQYYKITTAGLSVARREAVAIMGLYAGLRDLEVTRP